MKHPRASRPSAPPGQRFEARHTHVDYPCGSAPTRGRWLGARCKMAADAAFPLPTIDESLVGSLKRTYDTFAATNALGVPENVEA